MTEQLLYDLMGNLDVSLLENEYLERDLGQQKKAVRRTRFGYKRRMKKGTEFVLTDSLKNAVFEQRELMDAIVAPSGEEDSFAEKIDEKVKSVKKKVNRVITIISGIAAMVVVTVSVVLVIIKKKNVLKIFGKRVTVEGI